MRALDTWMSECLKFQLEAKTGTEHKSVPGIFGKREEAKTGMNAQ